MKNRINVAELLMECPEGMELDCVMFEKPVKYVGLTNSGTYIKIKTSCDGVFYLTKEGYLHNMADSKCIIFPKGKTTWEGFQRPFKDGDILYVHTSNQWICIYKEGGEKENVCRRYVAATSLIFVHDDFPLCHRNNIKEIRLATEEEKQKLFKAIKDNGYYWDAKNKVLEVLIEPKFKVGDRVRNKNNHNVVFVITSIEEDSYCVCGAEKIAFRFNDQDDYELINEPKFKVGDRIRHKNDKTIIRTIDYIYYDSYALCDGHILFFKEQDNYELVPNKFDINTLVPFESRVLVRDRDNDVWRASFWGCLIKNRHGYNYDTTRGYSKQCIPYEGNEHLLGKTDNCIDFYKTW